MSEVVGSKAVMTTTDRQLIEQWLREWVGRPARVATANRGARIVVEGTLREESGDFSVCCDDGAAVFMPYSVQTIARDEERMMISF